MRLSVRVKSVNVGARACPIDTSKYSERVLGWGKSRPEVARRGRFPGAEREFSTDNLLVRITFIIVVIRWTGLLPWVHFPSPLSFGLTDNCYSGSNPSTMESELAKLVSPNRLRHSKGREKAVFEARRRRFSGTGTCCLSIPTRVGRQVTVRVKSFNVGARAHQIGKPK